MKKAEAPTAKPLLGRPSGALKMGIVGLPNVGKSTLFNIMTKMNIPAENFPFCTIDPNTSRVFVPDPRFDHLVELFKPKSRVEAYLEVTDIAGLVKGASDGKGLGNKFLANIAAVDGIYHVVRAFEDEVVAHVEGDVDSARDLDIINNELRLKDLSMAKAYLDKIKKVAERQDKSRRKDLPHIEKVIKYLEDGGQVRTGAWTPPEIEVVNDMRLLTAKPVVYLVNISERDFKRKKNKQLPRIIKWLKENSPGDPIIPFCAALEAMLISMSPEEGAAYLKENAIGESAIPKIIRTGYSAIHLINFFTVGADEVRAWTIRQGFKAPDAAGAIHTDFKKTFICAEVYKYSDLKKLGSVNAVKAAGEYRKRGKDYTVEDGDIMLIQAGAARGKKR